MRSDDSRSSLDTHAFTPTNTLLRKLGFDDRALPHGSEGLRLEWTVLGNELLAFAGSLPLWLRGRLDPTESIPLKDRRVAGWHP